MATKIEKQGPGVPLQVQCGNCVHFRRIAAFKDVCVKLGIKEFAPPCTKFVADFHQFSRNAEFAKFLAATPDDQLQPLLALINAEVTTRHSKFRYGMAIYVRLFGDDYISNYVKCYVMMAKGRYVYVELPAQENYYGVFLKKSVFTEAQFLKKLKLLASNNKLRDPKFKQYSSWQPKEPRDLRSINDIPPINDVIKNVKRDKITMSWSVNDQLT
jgi:hypothetical protein